MGTITPAVEAVDGRRTDTRSRAISVAATPIAERGYAGTSIRDITDALGVSKAALYYHFSSKEEILRAIVNEPLEEVRQVVEAHPDLTTREERAEFLMGVARALGSCPPDAIAVFSEPEIVAITGNQQKFAGVTNTIGILLAQGLSGTSDPELVNKEHLVRAIGAVGAGEAMLNAWYQVNPGHDQVTEEGLTQIVDVVLRALEG